MNFHKNMLFGVNVYDSWLYEPALVMSFKHGWLCFIYLGLLICGDSRKLNFWYPLIYRIKIRLSRCKSRNLSTGDRLILLKSVILHFGLLSSLLQGSLRYHFFS